VNWIRELKKWVLSVLKNEMDKMHSHIPAQVVAYDPEMNTCSIQLCVNVFRIDDTDTGNSEIPVIEDIPVHFAGSGNVFLTCPVKKGSYGSYHVAEDDINDWLAAGGVVAPSSIDRFNLDSGFFEPAAPWMFDESFGRIATDRLSIRTRDGSTEISVLENGDVEINSSGNIIMNGSDDAVALASKVDDFISKIDTIFRTTWVPAAPDAGAALKTAYTATFVSPPLSVESEKVKVES
jgi:hypothetical protein